MKRLVIALLFLLVIPICFADLVTVDRVGRDTFEIPEQGVTYYALLNENVVASVDLGRDTVPVVIYYHKDRIGSNTMISNGEIVRSKTLPFGKELESPNFRFTFTGKERDPSGLYYYGARYYDPDVGRFISTDPVMKENPFVYVDNNPLKFIDPTGMQDEELDDSDEFVPTWYVVDIDDQGVGNIYVMDSNMGLDLGMVRGGDPSLGGTYGRTRPGEFEVRKIYRGYTTPRWDNALIPQGAIFTVDYEKGKIMFDKAPEGPNIDKDIGQRLGSAPEYRRRGAEIRRLFGGVTIQDLYTNGLTLEQAEFLKIGSLEVTRFNTESGVFEGGFNLVEETYSRNPFGRISVRLGESGQLLHEGSMRSASHGCCRINSETATPYLMEHLKVGDMIRIVGPWFGSR